MIIVSFATREPDYQKLAGLTFGTLSQADRQSTRQSWTGLDVAASIGLLALIIAAYFYFSG